MRERWQGRRRAPPSLSGPRRWAAAVRAGRRARVEPRGRPAPAGARGVGRRASEARGARAVGEGGGGAMGEGGGGACLLYTSDAADE